MCLSLWDTICPWRPRVSRTVHVSNQFFTKHLGYLTDHNLILLPQVSSTPILSPYWSYHFNQWCSLHRLNKAKHIFYLFLITLKYQCEIFHQHMQKDSFMLTFHTNFCISQLPYFAVYNSPNFWGKNKDAHYTWAVLIPYLILLFMFMH